MLDDNDLEELKGAFERLLWGTRNIQSRYDSFKTSTKGFGTATITEILSFIYPEEYGIWNNQARKALTYLGFKNEISFIKKSQLNGSEYSLFNQYLKEIRAELLNLGVEDLDLLGINYFLFEVASHPEVIEDTKTGKPSKRLEPVS